MKIISFVFAALVYSLNLFAAPVITDNHIKIDQFGYRPADRKIAVISNPVTGYNSSSHYSPGNNFQVRRWSDDAVVYSGTISAWNGGATHSQSGDKVWWFDFSTLTAEGTYYIFDITNNAGSYQFDINENVFFNPMKQALRTFYYQRCGIAKSMPYAQTGWTDAACHKGSLQDLDCRLYNNTNPSTSKDLSGGWHDAGDYNKYVNFTFETMIDLMLAFKFNTSVRGDNYNIPESGNGIPDILDEVKYELDWLLKMQNANGSVLSITGVMNYTSASPPSSDNSQRFYGPATTSASYTASALFALGAIQFNSIGQTTYASTLQTAAVNAWNWAVSNPNITFYNSGIVGAGEQEVSTYEKLVRKMAAASFLFGATGNTTYKTFFESNYTQMHLIQWGYAYPFENGQQDMLLYYSSLAGASASVSNAIKNAFKNSMKINNTDNLPAYTNNADAYRAYLSDNNYTWGSNTTKSRQGIMFADMIYYSLDTLNNQNYRGAALGFINYFHGINPTAFCYLTNMGSYGAENSVNEVYHSWFSDGSSLWDRVGTSAYGPAPGFMPGGVNPTYALDFCCPSGCGSYNSLCNTALVTPPLGQPIQKSYRDWNTSWPQNSWTITEPGIYTQASYLRLISGFLSSSSQIQIKSVIQGFYDPVNNRMNMKDTVKAYLRNITSPYFIADSSKSLMDSLSFTGSFVFSKVISGNYYIVLKHRNSIEIWSKSGGESVNPGSVFVYDFKSDSSNTFGQNVVRVNTSPLTFAIYNGDVNLDGIIDAMDVSEVDNDASASLSGYISTDLTGDYFADAEDVSIADNNSYNSVIAVKP
ncbi:MAG: glycoside hydrolase family 9 protein [Ignavibacteria bacterium]|nr:glycoside hydrolase family 9 protein [Ignavibacteria bacterium]